MRLFFYSNAGYDVTSWAEKNLSIRNRLKEKKTF